MFRDYLSWGHHISHLSRGPSRPRSALDSSCVPNSSRLPSTASTNEFLATKTGQNPPVLLAIGKRPSTNEDFPLPCWIQDFPLPCWITMFQMMLARWMAIGSWQNSRYQSKMLEQRANNLSIEGKTCNDSISSDNRTWKWKIKKKRHEKTIYGCRNGTVCKCSFEDRLPDI